MRSVQGRAGKDRGGISRFGMRPESSKEGKM